MKYKCDCGKTHDFRCFRRVRIQNMKISYYQFFCKELNKLMVLETKTFGSKTIRLVCSHSYKKLVRFSKLMTSDEYMA